MSSPRNKRHQLVWAKPVVSKPSVSYATSKTSTKAKPRTRPAWHKQAKILFDQQLWCWGRDVFHEQGNILIRYGFQRQPPPAKFKNVASLYILQNSSVTVILRGFGMFFGNAEHGYIFIDRASFSVKWFAELPPQMWTLEQILELRHRQNSPHIQTQKDYLLARCTRWLQAYEFWIKRQFGSTWRENNLLNWQRSCCQGSEMAAQWREIHQQIQRSQQ